MKKVVETLVYAAGALLFLFFSTLVINIVWFAIILFFLSMCCFVMCFYRLASVGSLESYLDAPKYQSPCMDMYVYCEDCREIVIIENVWKNPRSDDYQRCAICKGTNLIDHRCDYCGTLVKPALTLTLKNSKKICYNCAKKVLDGHL